jgi:hypothetical protein
MPDVSPEADFRLQFIQPASGSTCTGGTPCVLSWLDDGDSPLLNAVGVVTAGLFHGKQVGFYRPRTQKS